MYLPKYRCLKDLLGLKHQPLTLFSRDQMFNDLLVACTIFHLL